MKGMTLPLLGSTAKFLSNACHNWLMPKLLRNKVKIYLKIKFLRLLLVVWIFWVQHLVKISKGKPFCMMWKIGWLFLGKILSGKQVLSKKKSKATGVIWVTWCSPKMNPARLISIQVLLCSTSLFSRRTQSSLCSLSKSLVWEGPTFPRKCFGANWSWFQTLWQRNSSSYWSFSTSRLVTSPNTNSCLIKFSSRFCRSITLISLRNTVIWVCGMFTVVRSWFKSMSSARSKCKESTEWASSTTSFPKSQFISCGRDSPLFSTCIFPTSRNVLRSILSFIIRQGCMDLPL